MKGAIGNAFIMNMVIIFIIIFFSLLIGSMAYSKAYKIKNYLINEIDLFEKEKKMNFDTSDIKNENFIEWENTVNSFLNNTGYHIATDDNTCPIDPKINYVIRSSEGRYEYCIIRIGEIYDSPNSDIRRRFHYQVKVYMKTDLPIIGKILKIPLVGETQSYTEFKWEKS